LQQNLRIIESASGKVVKDLGESGSSNGKSITAPVPPTQRSVPALPDTGWIENAQWRVGGTKPIVYFSTKWIVPPAPASSDNQTVFLFNAMQPDSGAHIIQPVLQWGPSHAGGGNYWSIANWYADGQGGGASVRGLILVNPGDVLQGVMTCTGQTGTEYSYKCSFVGFPSIDVTVSDVDQLTWAYETLECYGLRQCADYPDTTLTAMYDIELRTGTPGTSGSDATLDWFPVTTFTDCGQNCSIISDASPGGVGLPLHVRTIPLARDERLFLSVTPNRFQGRHVNYHSDGARDGTRLIGLDRA
jgi:hypothetical protein